RSRGSPPAGKAVVSAGGDNVIRVWNASSGQLRQTLRAHSATVAALAFAPEAKFLYSGSQDKTIKVWKAKPPPAESLATIKAHAGDVRFAVLSGKGDLLVTGGTDHP